MNKSLNKNNFNKSSKTKKSNITLKIGNSNKLFSFNNNIHNTTSHKKVII